MTNDSVLKFVAQGLRIFLIKNFNLQNVLNFSNTRPWRVENSSVAYRLRSFALMLQRQKTLSFKFSRWNEKLYTWNFLDEISFARNVQNIFTLFSLFLITSWCTKSFRHEISAGSNRFVHIRQYTGYIQHAKWNKNFFRRWCGPISEEQYCCTWERLPTTPKSFDAAVIGTHS